MDRKEAMKKIKELGLQEEVEKLSGFNWTRSKTSVLEQVIWNYDATLADRCPDCEEKTIEGTLDIVQPTKEKPVEPNPYETACLAFLGVLKDTGVLDDLLDKL